MNVKIHYYRNFNWQNRKKHRVIFAKVFLFLFKKLLLLLKVSLALQKSNDFVSEKPKPTEVDLVFAIHIVKTEKVTLL